MRIEKLTLSNLLTHNIFIFYFEVLLWQCFKHQCIL